MKRINSIDFVRGFVMIIMALDHVRDLLHVTALTQNPTDLSVVTPGIFLTRWITHLCAPTFVFLSGASAFMSFNTKKDVVASRKFLLSRGLWLIFLEFTIINFGLWFDIGFHNFIFQVIGAIGFGFIILSFLLKLSPKTIGIIGLVIVFGHRLIALTPLAGIPGVSMLFGPTAIPFGTGRVFIMGYPPVPWLGIMLAGFGAGSFFLGDSESRKKIFLRLGLGAIVLFVILRFINIYGDPAPWFAQKNSLYTFFSFINISKYPPSLFYALATLGIIFFVFYFSEGKSGSVIKVVSVYGKVPLFYFILHFYIIHILGIIMVRVQGFGWPEIFSSQFGRPPGSGIELPYIYLIWIALVVCLYPVCLWYGKYKQRHPEKEWLRYL
jgi:uncharacterized membrane protein